MPRQSPTHRSVFSSANLAAISTRAPTRPVATTIQAFPADLPIYFSFSQLIEVAGKRGLRIQSSGFATQAAESDFRDAVRIFSNMVRDAYYDLLLAQENRWLAQEIVDHYGVISKANSLRLKSGDISESDFLRVKMEAMRAQSDLDNAQTAVEQAQANLAVILRWPDKSLQFEAKEQWPEVKNIGQNLPKEELISKALQQRPDLEADKQRAEQARQGIGIGAAAQIPGCHRHCRLRPRSQQQCT